MAQEFQEKHIHVLLDFQGKDAIKSLNQLDVKFRIFNLNETKPIVEIGDDVYEGTYDDAVGTNVYFEEVENPAPKTNLFEGITPITLKYLVKQSKLLVMRKIGTKPNPLMSMNPTETVNIKIDEDYRMLLEKLKNNELNIEDYISNGVSPEEDENDPYNKSDDEEEEQDEPWPASQLPPRQNLIPEWYTSAQELNSNKPEQVAGKNDVKTGFSTYAKYEKLQKLAEHPTQHKVQSETVKGITVKESIDFIPRNKFYMWKKLILQCVENQEVNFNINKDKMEDFVDVEKSIKAGVISPSNETPRVFTSKEKEELLSFKNFINVSPLMKLIMLQDYVNLQKTAMADMNEEELNVKSEHGYTIKERFTFMKNFKNELQSHLILRLQDESSNENLEENISLNLSDSEDGSDSDDFSCSSDDEDNEQ